MSDAPRTGILGGTFDPVHRGHLDAAAVAADALALDRVVLLPSRIPPHRPVGPRASGYHRFAMAALAATLEPRLVVSDLELRGTGASFTSETLDRLLASGYDGGRLFFVTGADAFAEIASWKDYPTLLDRCHFVVVSRPGHPAPDVRRRVPELASRMIDVRPGQPSPEAAVSPTAILLVDADTADVSSTEIRRRVTRGEAIDGLVPASVATHVARHGLYASDAAADALHD